MGTFMVKEFNQRMRGTRRVGKGEGQSSFRYPSLPDFAHFMLPCEVGPTDRRVRMDVSNGKPKLPYGENGYINTSDLSSAFLSFKPENSTKSVL